ncbi:hypothetical protein A5719_29840 [Mycolicibacterium peregrinum]|uniref:Shedu immune nuclease family protein n=1 Tax=Mycolicibacterium peregrinum TaxID=43304 RepID=UPI0007EA6C8E|nr:Shedu immune nuclease family protein [Mycolicibacterium peregrinum]OBF31981.1 hypothetical protein A5719_29840 [Mycolicibacterium peregrinum]
MSDWIEVFGPGSDTEFAVGSDDFSKLEIRQSPNNQAFYYFYDTEQRRLITDFMLHDGSRVSTLCTVTLILANDTYTPRLKVWKKDKRRGAVGPHAIEGEPRAHIIKASVDIRDGNENLWSLISFLQGCKEIAVPRDVFRIVGEEVADLAELISTADKPALLEAMRTALGETLTQADLDLMINRKSVLERFRRMLAEPEYFSEEQARLGKTRLEDVWQCFFEENPWIFGYGLSLISCESYDDQKLEQITTGASLFAGAGKRSDAVLRMRGAVSSLLFCEIKRHDTPLISGTPYRAPDVYRASNEVVGAVSQVQKTADKAVRDIGGYVRRHYESDGTPSGFEVTTVRPRQVVVVGQSTEFEVGGSLNPEKVSSFEQYRRSVLDTEIVTFDELYERARFIVGD